MSSADIIRDRALELKDMGFLRRMLWDNTERLSRSALLFRIAGDMYVKESNAECGVKMYLFSEEMYALIPDYVRVGEILALLKEVYLSIGDYHNYRLVMEKTIEMYTELDHPSAIPLLLELAQHHLTHISTTSAIIVYNRAGIVSQFMSSTSHAMTAFNRVIELSIGIDDYLSAAHAYRELATIFKESEYLRHRHHMGCVLCHLADSESHKAAEVCERISDTILKERLLELVHSQDIATFKTIEESIKDYTSDTFQTLVLSKIKDKMCEHN